MTRIKFNIDGKGPDEKKMAAGKDFRKLMYNYQHATKPLYRTPLYKNRKVYLIILLILLVTFVVIEILDKEECETPAKQEQPIQP